MASSSAPRQHVLLIVVEGHHLVHRSFSLFIACAVAAGCHVPLRSHQSGAGITLSRSRLPAAGERSVDLRTWYGLPILQKSFFWDGNGETDNAGIRARHFWHLTDRLALGAGLAASAWFENGPDGFAAEAEGVGRCYLHRGDSVGVFAELSGGWLQATRPVPAGGTEWNMTFSFGPGVEIPIDDRVDLIAGVTYHHISNALGHENPRNPSQNEVQFWFGMGVRL